MSQNLVKNGNVITCLSVPYAVNAGDGVLWGARGTSFGVAEATAAINTAVEVAVVGVFTLPKATGSASDAFADGQLVCWDSSAKKITGVKTAASTFTAIGAAVGTTLQADTTGVVRLWGAARAPNASD